MKPLCLWVMMKLTKLKVKQRIETVHPVHVHAGFSYRHVLSKCLLVPQNGGTANCNSIDAEVRVSNSLSYTIDNVDKKLILKNNVNFRGSCDRGVESETD